MSEAFLMQAIAGSSSNIEMTRITSPSKNSSTTGKDSKTFTGLPNTWSFGMVTLYFYFYSYSGSSSIYMQSSVFSKSSSGTIKLYWINSPDYEVTGPDVDVIASVSPASTSITISFTYPRNNPWTDPAAALYYV